MHNRCFWREINQLTYVRPADFMIILPFIGCFARSPAARPRPWGKNDLLNRQRQQKPIQQGAGKPPGATCICISTGRALLLPRVLHFAGPAVFCCLARSFCHVCGFSLLGQLFFRCAPLLREVRRFFYARLAFAKEFASLVMRPPLLHGAKACPKKPVRLPVHKSLYSTQITTPFWEKGVTRLPSQVMAERLFVSRFVSSAFSRLPLSGASCHLPFAIRQPSLCRLPLSFGPLPRALYPRKRLT